MATWHDETSITLVWRDAEGISDPVLTELLTVAREAVVAYAPDRGEDADPDDVPESWVWAQYLHARNIWNASKASPSGDFDGGEYGLRAFPLDWQVKQLVRPKRALPVIG